MNRKLLLFSFALLGLASRPCVATTFDVTVADDPAYVQGTQAMNDQRWSDAVHSFDMVINAKGKKADAAYYWKAYSLNKLGQAQLAADTCVQLHMRFKDSTWNEDCRVLSLSLSDGQNHSASPAISESLHSNPKTLGGAAQKPEDAELKVLALNSVIRRDPAQGSQLIRNLLTSDESLWVKQHAIFILTQNNSPEAQGVMRDLVLSKIAPDMQRYAIKDCVHFGDKRMDDALTEAYRASNDVKIKHAIY